MYYVSQYNSLNDTFGITDTSDGVTEFYTMEEILSFPPELKIKGVSGSSIQIVDASTQVAGHSFDKFAEVVKRHVSAFTEESCMNIARTAHFVKKIKGITDINEIRRITYENIYPDNIREVVSTASEYTNSLREVNCSNPRDIRDALMNNVCLVLQHKTTGVLTAFICSGSMKVLDALYEPYFFDSVYLTKQLYGYTVGIEKVRRVSDTPREKNPDLLNVFSCSLRFRRDGVHHDKENKVLSSPFYTVNPPRVLAMFVLDNPSKLGNRILPEFHQASDKTGYDFDFKLYRDIRKCVADGINYFCEEGTFLRYVDTKGLTQGVEITEIIERFQDNFEYMKMLRDRGYSFFV